MAVGWRGLGGGRRRGPGDRADSSAPASITTGDRSGKRLVACILLGLSFIFTFHVSVLGSVGMPVFLLAVVGVVTSRENKAILVLNELEGKMCNTLRSEYRYLAPRLSEAGYRAVTVDLRGHGESSVPSG